MTQGFGLQHHLFVYGTLMTAAAAVRLGTAERARLQREAESLGPATMPGRLYDLGRYPGMLAAQSPEEIVHGEVYRLADPTAAFRWLDAYENAAPADPAREYERALAPARLASGEVIEAWVYLWLGNVAEARLVRDGRWQP